MKKNKLLLGFIVFLILIIGFVGCKSGATSEQLASTETPILKGQKIELSDTYSAMDLEIVDSMLIVLCYGDQYKFHVYNKNTLKFIGKFGQEGRGPSEYMMPILLSQKMKIRDSAYLTVYDNVIRRLSFVNILKAINNKSYYPETINSRDRRISHLALLGSATISADSIIVGSSADQTIEGRFFCYNIRKDILTWEPFYPVPKIPPVKSLKGPMYKTYLALRPDGKNIAAASLFFERIDVLDNKGKLNHSVVFENQDRQDFSDPRYLPPKGSHEYFTSVSVSQDFIYAINIDITIGPGEIRDTAYLVKVPWDEAVKSPIIYKVTPKVLKIRVDEENNRIIGLKPFNSFIYVYKMGNQLQDKTYN